MDVSDHQPFTLHSKQIQGAAHTEFSTTGTTGTRRRETVLGSIHPTALLRTENQRTEDWKITDSQASHGNADAILGKRRHAHEWTSSKLKIRSRREKSNYAPTSLTAIIIHHRRCSSEELPRAYATYVGIHLTETLDNRRASTSTLAHRQVRQLCTSSSHEGSTADGTAAIATSDAIKSLAALRIRLHRPNRHLEVERLRGK
ncbi:uncharacterized protein LOC135167684 isoform X2 [Diachasmimorpha longicaudata]|uniref:uncharacterized protein LOC135167684 isoform X2 n=1 Tax=Diachasmimorpha longicaudata TaxID=58733 RepID=UPI0030B89AC6